MKQYREEVSKIISKILTVMILDAAGDGGKIVDPTDVVSEIPPKTELGDLAFPMFPYAKALKSAPAKIAQSVADTISRNKGRGDAVYGILENAVAAGPYVNIRLKRLAIAAKTLTEVAAKAESYGSGNVLGRKRVMVEFSCPNTNKPLHLGHLRNDAIGESVARILAAAGADVRKVNLINDRGVHICKSMLAYTIFGDGRTPESEGIKSDHFVGEYYVKYDAWAKQNAGAETEVRQMLMRWEQGDPETIELWKRMNHWTISGIETTYKRTGIHFDKIYYESETYARGREEVRKGLAKGIFYKDDQGTVWVDLTDMGLDKKVLLRGDGTSLYLTQDIGTAIARQDDWAFERLIYVVGSEQQYHFKVLFRVLAMLGFFWADNLHHLAYGMVNLPEGKMKSREGTVVDADDLLDELSSLALEEIQAKGREEMVGDAESIAERIALGALNYFLLQTDPFRDMTFNPRDSLSFNGNTGPYLQYTGARISNMIRKFEENRARYKAGKFDPGLLTVSEEWELIKLISSFPQTVEEAALALNPSVITSGLYDLARIYSRYYHDNPVLQNDNPNLVVTRITLSRAVGIVLKRGFDLLGIPFLEIM